MSSDDDSHRPPPDPDHGAAPPAAGGSTGARVAGRRDGGRDAAAGVVVRLFDLDPLNPGRVVTETRGYWQGLRQGMAIPTRADIDPQGMRRSLDYAFILERIAPGAARFRLAGRHLIDVMGMEVRGMPVCAFFNPSARGHLSDLLETVFQGPQIVELALASEGDYGRPALSARMLLLPLRSDLGDVTRALGCFITESEIGRAPRRFDIESHALEPVIPGARTLAPASGFAESAEPWRNPPAAAAAAEPSARPRGAKAGRRKAAADSAAPPVAESPEDRRARFRVISRD